jgi:hypothetical protein
MSYRDGSALTGSVDGLVGLHGSSLPAAAYLAFSLWGLDGGMKRFCDRTDKSILLR